MPIAVAVSKGADSLAALLSLIKAGHQVLAVHALLTEAQAQDSAGHDRLQGICAELHVPLHFLDLRRPFNDLVVAPFLRSYAQGLTPNPCAACNARIKFKLLRDSALGLGCQGFATGHYARLGLGQQGPLLQRGIDSSKDQSYFLGLVPPQALSGLYLPLGTKTKAEAYAELSSLGLQPPSSTESQEICFIPDDDYRLFLEQALDDLPGPGPIIDHQGRSYGQHQGLWRYTLGQRRGLGIAHSQPLYVLKKDISNNTLIVGPKARCWIGHCLVSDLNPFLPVADWPSQTWIQTNYRRPAVACRVQRQDRQILARFEPTGPTAPGQLACFYDRLGRLLAGGLIQPEV